MLIRSAMRVLSEISPQNNIYIFPYGKAGREISTFLEKRGVKNLVGLDNNAEKKADSNVILPKEVQIDSNSKFILATFSKELREVLKRQLFDLGVAKQQIIVYYPEQDIEYRKSLTPDEYEDEISAIFFEANGYEMDWKNPKTYNQIICYEKIHNTNPIRTQLADKYLVREWVRAKIGDDHLVKQYGAWEKAEDIDYDELPDRFVVKANNGSGRNIIVTDKKNADLDAISLQLNEWLSSNYMYNNFELHYGKIVPKIIAEEYLEGIAENLYDYNIFCFHGEPQYIWCIKGSHRPGCTAAFYNKEWKKLDCYYGYPMDMETAPKPEMLGEMLELTKILCANFDHVRVDWYITKNSKVLFGEMTFTTWGGVAKFEPREYDELFGKMIRQC